MLMRHDQFEATLSVSRDATDLDAVAEAVDPRHAFLRHAWYAADAGEELKSLAARRADGSPLAAFPVATRRVGPLAIAQVAGSYWPIRGLPIAADAASEELANLLGRRDVARHLGRCWRLGPVFSDDSATARMTEAARRAGWTVLTRRIGTSFEFDFTSLLSEGPWPRVSSEASNRRRARKLEKIGAIDYRFVSGRDWTPADRDAMARIEAESWLAGIGKNAAPKFHDPARRLVWERAAKDPIVADMMFCSLMLVGGEPAAFAFGVEAGGVRHCIANSYSQRFGQHGPGKLLLYRDFAMAAERGVDRVNWGCGDAGYKTEMGANAGPEIQDLLFVRSALLGWALRRYWTDAL